MTSESSTAHRAAGQPSRLGRFELQEILGKGGMGVVYRALDTETGRAVAIKCLLGDFKGTRLARFQREAEVTASLSHPGILRVHELGVEDDRPYLVCELIEGARTLRDVAGELSRRERLVALRQAAEALGFAHARGVVHRDVKPDNLLIDSDGCVRVADFGLAAAEGAERLTKTGTMLGTPNYMPPELVTGQHAKVGAQSDVWSLGVVLFELLVEQLPFTGQTIVELASAITSGGDSDPGHVDASVPGSLRAICLRALERSPADRYPDASALAQDLQAYLEGGEVGARRARPPLLRVLLAFLGLGAAVWLGRGAFADPAPPDLASPSVTRSSRVAEPISELDAIAALEGIQRARALEEWLDGHPGHPEWKRALAQHDLLWRQGPLATLSHSERREVGARFLASGEFVSWGHDSVLRRWSGTGRELSRWDGSSHGFGGFACLVELREGFVLGTQRDRHLRVGFDQALTVIDVHANCLAAAPDGLSYLVGGLDGSVRRFDAQTGEPRGILAELPDEVWDLCFAPDGERLFAFVGGFSGRTSLEPANLLILDAEAGDVLATVRYPALGRRLRFGPEGRTFAVGTIAGQVLLCDASTGKPVHELRSNRDDQGEAFLLGAHRGPVKGTVFSPGGGTLYSIGKGPPVFKNELIVWDLAKREQRGAVFLRPRSLYSLDISADGRRLIIGTGGAQLEVWATPYDAP